MIWWKFGYQLFSKYLIGNQILDNFKQFCTVIDNYRQFIYIFFSFLFTDEAPDTGDDSDEDLVTNYLAKGTGTVGATSDTLVPTIHITPQSPNGNHVLGKKKYFYNLVS